MAKAPKKQTLNDLTMIPSDYISTVVSGLKRSFSRGPVVRKFLLKHRREEDWFKKDGSKSKKKHVFYTCAHCNKEFNSAQVQVDHIEPVVPLNIPQKHMSMGEFMKRLYVEEDGLQILCKPHHKEKSDQENLIRKEWVTKTKYIVYQTHNRSNHKSYIGVHKCDSYDDGYIGSGKLFKVALHKYGSKSFYRCVLFSFETAEEAFLKEKELVNDDWTLSEDNYNLALGGSGGEGPYSNGGKRVICHQTGEIFDSVSDVAKKLNISISSISKALNDPNKPIRNLHFFTTEGYEPNIKVTFPINNSLRKIVHLNTKTTFESIESAATALNLNYKSLRNALLIKTLDGVYAIHDNYFLYDYEYDPTSKLEIVHRRVECVELKKTFDTCTAAAAFLKHKNPAFGGISIGKAIRTGTKMYKYHWRYIESIQILQ